jgi:hypothetical protein
MNDKEIQEMINRNELLPSGLTTTGDLYLGSYAHALPSGLTTTGYLYLGSYAHALPSGLTTTRDLELGSYAHALPSGLTTTGNLELGSYAHALPSGLTTTYKNDLFEVLTVAEKEVPALLKALRYGRVEGSTYSGECKCLVGTLEEAGRGRLSLPHRPERLAERWFAMIHKGDTPVTCAQAKYAEEWVLEFMERSESLTRLSC